MSVEQMEEALDSAGCILHLAYNADGGDDGGGIMIMMTNVFFHENTLCPGWLK